MVNEVAVPHTVCRRLCTGYPRRMILFVDGDVLMSRSFDPQRLQLSGEATPITDLIEIFANKPQVSSANNGTLVYQAKRTFERNACLARPQRKIPGCSPPEYERTLSARFSGRSLRRNPPGRSACRIR